MMWTAGAEEDEESESMGLGVESDMAMAMIIKGRSAKMTKNENGLNNEMFMSDFVFVFSSFIYLFTYLLRNNN